MQLSLQNFTTLVQNMSASAQGACSDLIDVTVGSVTRALLEASASVALWLQYLILQVMATTRLATSTGDDVDSWVGDFGLDRLAGTPAEGVVTLTCFAPQSQSATVQIGSIVRTSNGSSTFAVVQDSSNSAWSPGANAYVRPAGTAAIDVPVQATFVGLSGNVQAGTINLLGQAISGIDTVSNTLPLHSGSDPESDVSLRSRFVGYVNSRSRATIQAVENAVLTVQQGLSATVVENSDAAGNSRIGTFTVVVDDGSGSPPDSLIAQVFAAVDLVRPIGSLFSVVRPQIVQADISCNVTVAPGANAGAVAQSVEAAIAQFVDNLPVGALLPYSRLANVAYQADPNVTNVLGLTLNGGAEDVGGGVAEVVRINTVTVS